MNTQAKVALDKQKHPERYCSEPRCLWKVRQLNKDMIVGGDTFIPARTIYEPKPDCPGGRCPRHQRNETIPIGDWPGIRGWKV